MTKTRTAVAGLLTTALLVVPAAADAKKQTKRAKRAASAPALKVNLQVLQQGCIVGTKGTYLLGQPVDLCI